MELALLAIPATVVMLTLVGWYQYIRAQMRHYGHIPVLWRWISGGLHHGIKNEHDRRYRAQYDPHSQHYHFKARLHRAIIRDAFTFGPPLILLAWMTGNAILIMLSVFISVGLLAEITWRIYRTEKVLKSRRLVRSIGKVAAPHVSRAVHGRHANWLRFTDPQTIHAKLPKNWNGSDHERERFRRSVVETAGFHPSSEADWHLEGDESHVIIANRKASPDRVDFADIELAIAENADDVVTLGRGRGNELVNVSLTEESPNFGLSIGTGGGKSQLARLVACQVLHAGHNVLILDPKRISHAWAKGLPNVRYARTPQEIHEALVGLNVEINRRTNVADAGHDVEGEVLANVGPRRLVIAEELNEMNQRERIYWNEVRLPKDPKKSPAISALESALFMGRQVKVNIIAVAQMMTALAAGSGAARENMGVRILGRYTRNNWRMLVPEFDMPFRSMRPGRVQVVTSKVTECQVAFISGADARRFAMSGIVTPYIDPVDDFIEAEVITSGKPALTSTSSNLKVVSEVVDQHRKVILSEAAGKIVPRTLKALKMARDRGDFPAPCGTRAWQAGQPKEYWADEIIAWDKAKRGES